MKARAASSAAIVAALAAACAPSAHAQTISTVPRIEGVKVTIGKAHYVTNARGEITIPPRSHALRDLRVTATPLRPGVQARFSRWYRGRVALAYWYLVKPEFHGPGGDPLPANKVSSFTMHSSIGLRERRVGSAPFWVQGSRIVPFAVGLRSKQISYAIDSVTVDGANVVNRSQQRFFPRAGRTLPIQLLFNSARFTARDAIFHFPVGSGVRLTFPNGHAKTYSFGRNDQVVIPALPRGEYKVKATGPGISFSRPVALSRDQDMSLSVITWLDIGVVLAIVAVTCLAVRAYRRRRNVSARLEAPVGAVAGGD
jgi:hypothetical protein